MLLANRFAVSVFQHDLGPFINKAPEASNFRSISISIILE
jgi:hypothetical protein